MALLNEKNNLLVCFYFRIAVTAVAWQPHGTYLASVDRAKMATVWGNHVWYEACRQDKTEQTALLLLFYFPISYNRPIIIIIIIIIITIITPHSSTYI